MQKRYFVILIVFSLVFVTGCDAITNRISFEMIMLSNVMGVLSSFGGGDFQAGEPFDGADASSAYTGKTCVYVYGAAKPGVTYGDYCIVANGGAAPEGQMPGCAMPPMGMGGCSGGGGGLGFMGFDVLDPFVNGSESNYECQEVETWNEFTCGENPAGESGASSCTASLGEGDFTYFLCTKILCCKDTPPEACVDADGDGYGAPGTDIEGCPHPEAHDCDDNDAEVNPGAQEVCDGIDNNCDGNINEGLSGCCIDLDGDGYSVSASDVAPCGVRDCNDDNEDIYPGAPEICDGVDNQCSGDAGYDEIDEECSADESQYICEQVEGFNWVERSDGSLCCGNDDGEDSPFEEQEGAEESSCLDGNDNDCDDFIDGEDSGCGKEYLDNDGDGYTPHDGDCNDNEILVNPGMDEIPYDGLDNDCDSATSDDDIDGDGYVVDCAFVDGVCEIDGGTDCDDFPNLDLYPHCAGAIDCSQIMYSMCAYCINPGEDVIEIEGDGIDNNCDGLYLECGDGTSEAFGPVNITSSDGSAYINIGVRKYFGATTEFDLFVYMNPEGAWPWGNETLIYYEPHGSLINVYHIPRGSKHYYFRVNTYKDAPDEPCRIEAEQA